MTEKKTVTKEELEAAFTEEGPQRHKGLCNLQQIIQDVDPSLGAVLAAKVKDQAHYSGATITRVIKKLGLGVVSESTIRKHRRGTCSCAPEADK